MNKGINQSIQNMKDDVDYNIKILSQPTRINKTPLKKSIDKYYTAKNKVYCGYNGLINPIKLNISQETLNKLNK